MPVTRASERRFYAAMALLAAALVFAGFARTFYLRAFTMPDPLPGLVRIHGAAFTAWMILLVVQVRLIDAGRTDLHRRLGLAGMTLAVTMVGLGFATAIRGARLDHYPSAFSDALAFLVIPLGDISIFAVLVACGYLWRRRPAAHKRLMLLATVGGLTPAAIGRIPGIAGSVPAIVTVYAFLLLMGPTFDLVTRRRIHPVFLIGAPVLFLSAPARLTLADTEAWHRFAAWLVG